ncbi:MAG TPA: hypothetical protein VFT37_03865 [Telluria sp.]|nr:hypothetical protein [Telluria sp.]
MKQFWIRLSTRVDALSLRERIMLFAAVLAGVVYAVVSFVLAPSFEQQEQLAAQIAQQQNAIVQIEGQIDALVKNAQIDPDDANRARLKTLDAEVNRLGKSMREMSESLVQPEQIAPLLERMLRSNGKLRLVSLQTLPVTGLSETLPAGVLQPPAAGAPPAQNTAAGATAAGAATAPGAPGAGMLPPEVARLAAKVTPPPAPAPAAVVAAPVAKAPELIYRHGVELTLEGGYVDMVNYMSALEAMPVRLIWGRAKLDASKYPQSRLTLTLFTLSLEKDWMKL